jgi:hypothetical protein
LADIQQLVGKVISDGEPFILDEAQNAPQLLRETCQNPVCPICSISKLPATLRLKMLIIAVLGRLLLMLERLQLPHLKTFDPVFCENSSASQMIT